MLPSLPPFHDDDINEYNDTPTINQYAHNLLYGDLHISLDDDSTTTPTPAMTTIDGATISNDQQVPSDDAERLQRQHNIANTTENEEAEEYDIFLQKIYSGTIMNSNSSSSDGSSEVPTSPQQQLQIDNDESMAYMSLTPYSQNSQQLMSADDQYFEYSTETGVGDTDYQPNAYGSSSSNSTTQPVNVDLFCK